MITPWMSKTEIDTILKYLNKDQTMLEYGCGGSTNFFCSYVKDYYSIEHNKEWFQNVESNKKNNVNISYVNRNKITPETERIVAKTIEELNHSSRYYDFYDYIHYPDTLGIMFDAVLIDGRARPECAKFIQKYVKKDGYVFVHDYWARKPYHLIENIYTLIDSVKTGQSLAVFKNST